MPIAISCPTATCSTSRPMASACGINNPLFGSAARSATFDDILRRGYGNRETNWEFSAGVQHEVLPRVSLDVGYFRRIWKNFRVTDNLAVAANDYDTFSMIVPTDPRLPGGGGNTLDGLVALKPDGVRASGTEQQHAGPHLRQPEEHWNGFDVTVDARLQNGLSLQVGTSTGETLEDDCDIVSKVPEMLNVSGDVGFAAVIVPAGTPTGWRPAQFCNRETPWLTQFKGYGVYIVPKVECRSAARSAASLAMRFGPCSTRAMPTWRPTPRWAVRWRAGPPTSRSTWWPPTRCSSTAGTSWTCASGRCCGRAVQVRSSAWTCTTR